MERSEYLTETRLIIALRRLRYMTKNQIARVFKTTNNHAELIIKTAEQRGLIQTVETAIVSNEPFYGLTEAGNDRADNVIAYDAVYGDDEKITILCIQLRDHLATIDRLRIDLEAVTDRYQRAITPTHGD